MDAILNILTQLWEFLSRVIISAFPILNALFIIGAGCLGMLLYGKFKPFVRDIIILRTPKEVLLERRAAEKAVREGALDTEEGGAE